MGIPARLFTVTDCSEKIDAQLALLCYSYLETIKKSHTPTVLTILHPSASTPHLPKFALASPYVETQKIPFSECDDPYATKLLLSAHIELISRETCLYIYLDADHFFRALPSLQSSVGAEILVGATQDQLDDDDANVVLFPEEKDALGNTHFNNSLIIGSTVILRQVFNRWPVVYSRLAGRVGKRFREEIAFSLAASELGYSCRSVPVGFQGSWDSIAQPCAVFHYGGNNRRSTRVKELLRNSSCSGFTREHLVEGVSEVEQELIEAVKALPW